MILHSNLIYSKSEPCKFVFWAEDTDNLPYLNNNRQEELSDCPYLVIPGRLFDILHPEGEECSAIILSKASLHNKSEPAFYKIKGVSYNASITMNLLLNILDKTKIFPDIVLAQDILFWIQASKLAAELIISHRYIPRLRKTEINATNNGKLLYIVWSILIDRHKDIVRVKTLRNGMPPYIRTCFETGININSITFPNEAEILTLFFDWACDGIVRDSFRNNQNIIVQHENNKNNIEKTYIHSLYSQPGNITHSGKRIIKSIATGYNKWIRPFKNKSSYNSFKTCIKISSPENFDSNWKLEYLLQSVNEPSLVVSAYDIWTRSGNSYRFLKENFNNPRERLLEDLGTASRIFPPILKSLYEATPSGVNINEEEAWQFLQESAVILEEAGFGIIVPAWWSKPSLLSLKLRVRSSQNMDTYSKNFFNLETLLNYDWKIALGNNELNDNEFEKLANLKIPLLQIRGQWIRLSKQQIQELSKLWQNRLKQSQTTLGEILRVSLGQHNMIPGMKVDSIDCEGHLKPLFSKLKGDAKLEELPAPEGFIGILRPYQIRGYSWLAFLRERYIGACLADDMGLGKTIQLIALMLYNKKKYNNQYPALLICPTSVVGNWNKEIQKFGPSLKVMIHHGPQRNFNKLFLNNALKNDIVLSTYALAHRDYNTFNQIEWSGIILDEAQNIKNPLSKQAQALKRLKRGYSIALTGTPLENRLLELWSIMDFLNPGYLGSTSTFRKEYIVPIEKEHDIESSSKLKSIILPFILRRLKTDPLVINDLPEKIETRVYCSLTKEQATLYEAVVQDMLKKIQELNGINRRGMILSALSRFKQIVNHPALFLKDSNKIEGRSGKLERLHEILEEILSEGDSVLIFTQFVKMGELLRTSLIKRFRINVLFLHGGIGRKTRENMIKGFQSEKSTSSIFILSLKAGGVGLNLTNANHVIHYDRWWNPAVENQATDRAFRIGQKKNVQVHKFVCPGTLEEKIDDMLEEKKDLAKNIIGTGENWLTEMSNSQLKELFSLNYVNSAYEEKEEF